MFSTNQLNTFSDRTKMMKQNSFRKYLFYYFENALRLIQGHLRTIIILTIGIKCHKGPTILTDILSWIRIKAHDILIYIQEEL